MKIRGTLNYGSNEMERTQEMCIYGTRPISS